MERAVLLGDFVKIHNHSFLRVIQATRTSFVPPLDHATELVSFVLTYRPDCEGNPAKAFKIKDAIVCPLADALTLPVLREGWEQGREYREREGARLRTSGGHRFDGFLSVSYTIDDGDFTFWSSVPMLWPPPEPEPDVGTGSDEKGPVLILRSDWIWNGWVLNPEETGGAAGGIGEMVKEGEHWKWRPFC